MSAFEWIVVSSFVAGAALAGTAALAQRRTGTADALPFTVGLLLTVGAILALLLGGGGEAETCPYGESVTAPAEPHADDESVGTRQMCDPWGVTR